jgi:hypothetical protein
MLAGVLDGAARIPLYPTLLGPLRRASFLAVDVNQCSLFVLDAARAVVGGYWRRASQQRSDEVTDDDELYNEGPEYIPVLGIGGQEGGKWFVLGQVGDTLSLLAGPYATKAGADRFVSGDTSSLLAGLTSKAMPKIDSICVVQSTGTWQDAAARAEEYMLAWKNMTPEERQSRIVHGVEDEEDDGDEDDGDKQS